MESFNQILETIQLLKYDERLIASYRQNFGTVVKAVDPETIYDAIQKLPDDLFILIPLYVGSLFTHHRFQEIYDFLQDIDLSGTDRHLDFFNGKLLKYYYLSLKHLGMEINDLYQLMATNKEYSNEYSVAVLTNCILDFQVNNNVYLSMETDIADSEECARYCFYNGIISLVHGDYRRALEFFNRSDILGKSRRLGQQIRKYTIVTKLLLGDYEILYPYSDELQPYFALIGVMKRADTPGFQHLLEEHKAEFFATNLYFVVRRLMSNLLLEGLRKISVCYSRIPQTEISRILGVNVDYLLHSTIKGKYIKGYVENGVFYSSHNTEDRVCLGERIRDVVNVRRMTVGMMTYPEIAPLTYEVVVENADKAAG